MDSETTSPYLVGNFAPVFEERTDDHPLPTDGIVPPDLDGRLIRNGPNPPHPPEAAEDYHWFLGDGMLHAVTLRDGRAIGYRNRWVRTRELARQLGTIPPRGPAEPIDGVANTNIVRHAGKLLALVESGLPHAVSSDLERATVFDFDSMLTSPMTAHPKIDPLTGEMVFFGYDAFGPPFARVHVADAAGTLTSTREVDLDVPVMMHDFGVTASRIALLDLPVVFDLGVMADGAKLPYRWDAERGARIGVLDRHATDSTVTWVPIDPCFVFHVANAYDEGDELVMDVIRYEAALDPPGPGPIVTGSPTFVRWRIDPAARTCSESVIDDRATEFPRVDDTRACLHHRYVYATDGVPDPGVGWTPRGLLKFDRVRDEVTAFDPGAERSCSEPVFVRAIDGNADDEGWVLSIVHDRTTDTSDLVILDATAFAGPPVATVHLPARVPAGFHGGWFPAT